MCPSIEATEAQREFAAHVLQNLLRRIDAENKKSGRHLFLVSHAWTEGPKMYLVYTAPPSDRTWGLVRDTRESIISPGPWLSVDEPSLYYYLVDFEENQPSSSFRQPGEPDTIWWFGSPREGLPEHSSDIPEKYGYTPPPGTPSAKQHRNQDQRVVAEPRRYGNPL
jgi:hypothetical protein